MSMHDVLTLPRLLVLSGHPVPTIAVTAMTTGLAAGAGNTLPTVVLVGVAVLSGQFSIGWSNDLIDARRDRLVGRTDKPVATGLIPARLVVAAVLLAVLVTVTSSLLLGWRAGLAQLVLVGSGWAYNVALKATLWSWLPFVTGFGAVPAVATLALPAHPWPEWWSLAAGGLVGVAAHLGNVLPDLAEDEATGVRGLPHWLGAAATAVTGLVAALASAALVVLAPPGAPSSREVIGLAAAAAVAIAGLVVVRRKPSSEAAFHATMVIAAIGVALLAMSPSFP
ncbi:MAG: UbiA family prenyltransferase [Nocardioidaceae bacterium]